PEIVLSEGKVASEESCLSVVDYSAEVSRNAQVKVRGVDRHGRPMDIEAEGLLAICLQHEIDHLNGTLYIDRISSLKRALYKKKLKKKLKKE
ncbi:MAG: peptide deformylase, partial [Desulfobacteraceae bacterium 4484_190.2]